MIVLDSLPRFSLDEKSPWAFIWRFWSRIRFQANSGDCRTKAPVFFLAVGKDPFSLLLWFMVSSIFSGEGNGTPLQYSCLENPRDGGAWWAALYGVAQSRTRLKRLSSSRSSSSSIFKPGKKLMKSFSAFSILEDQTFSSIGSPWLSLLYLRAYVMTWAHLNNSKQCSYFKGKQYCNYVSVFRD